MIQWWQCYDCWSIISIFKETDVFPVWELEFRPIRYFPVAISVLVAFNQHKYNKTKYWILLIRENSKIPRVLTLDMPSDIGAGAGKFLVVRRIFAQISPNLPEKTPTKMTHPKNDCIFSNQITCFATSKKALHVNSGAIIFKWKHVGRHFCSDFQGVLKGSQSFSRI